MKPANLVKSLACAVCFISIVCIFCGEVFAAEYESKTRGILDRFYVSSGTGPQWLDNPKWEYGVNNEGTDYFTSFKTNSVGLSTNVLIGYEVGDSWWGIGKNVRVETHNRFSRFHRFQSISLPASATTNFVTPGYDGSGIAPTNIGGVIDTDLNYTQRNFEIDELLKIDFPVCSDKITLTPYGGFSYKRHVQSYDFHAHIPGLSTANSDDDVKSRYLGGKMGSSLAFSLGSGVSVFTDGHVGLYQINSSFSGTHIDAVGVVTSAEDSITEFTYTLGFQAGLSWDLGWATLEVRGGTEYYDLVPTIHHNSIPAIAEQVQLREADATNEFVQVNVTVAF